MKKYLLGALISVLILSGCSKEIKIDSTGEIFEGTVKEIQITDEQEEQSRIQFITVNMMNIQIFITLTEQKLKSNNNWS